jgi:hypothetical protein
LQTGPAAVLFAPWRGLGVAGDAEERGGDEERDDFAMNVEYDNILVADDSLVRFVAPRDAAATK